jgi:hypothetical protein
MMCRLGRSEKSWSEKRKAAARAVVKSEAFDLTKGSRRGISGIAEGARTEMRDYGGFKWLRCRWSRWSRYEGQRADEWKGQKTVQAQERRPQDGAKSCVKWKMESDYSLSLSRVGSITAR